MAEVDKTGWKSGQWNAHVLMGETKEIRKARLEEVPKEYRASVEDHVRGVFKMRAAAVGRVQHK
jgi:hypothetical protein